MTTTVRRQPRRGELAVYRANKDGAQYDALSSVFGTTRAAKRQKVSRAVDLLAEALCALVSRGYDGEADRLCRKLDEVRHAGASIEATPDILCAIERADSADESPRLAWALDHTTDNAKAALHATDKAIDALLAFRRAVRCAHPELA